MAEAMVGIAMALQAGASAAWYVVRHDYQALLTLGFAVGAGLIAMPRRS